MNTLASKGPRGDPIATLSVCSYRAPLNWNSCPFGSYTEEVHKIHFGQVQVVRCTKPIVKALFSRSCIVSSKGTLVNREDTSYESKMSPFAISETSDFIVDFLQFYVLRNLF